MTAILRPLICAIVIGGPAIAVFIALILRKLQHDREARKPFTGLPLRAPGEFTRKMADELFESATEDMLLVLLGPFIGLVCGIATPPGSILVCAVVFILVAAFSTFLGLRVRNKLHKSWKYRLGALGEQVIARELDRLLAQGYQVFHDVPFETWNIDHVVVGPAGVFAVETKTWRKPSKDSKLTSEIIFDGDSLTRPGGSPDRHPIQQARDNARSLTKWISLSAAENVSVTPVVALPGWKLRIDRFSDVAVYSGTNIADNMIKRGKGELQPEQIQRIAFQLGKLCEMDLS